MAKEIKSVISRSGDRLVGEFLGALSLVAVFVVILHLPEIF